MKRVTSLKSIAVAAVVLGAVGAASVAHARTDVILSIGLQSPAYVQSAPVYVQPQYQYSTPTYVQPQYEYSAPVYVQPQYGYSQNWERSYGDRDGDGIANVYDRHDNRYNHHYQHRRARLYGPYGDLDGDGVQNRFDRAPRDPYRY